MSSRARAAFWLRLLPLLAVAGSGAPSGAAQEGRRVTTPPDLRTQLDLQHFYLPRELQVALSALETAYPEFLRLESLGRSASGAELWVMIVARKEGLEPTRRPAALLAAGLGLEDLASTELALFTILELVQNHNRDEAVARVLDHCTVYVAPCLNPDLRERVLGALERGDELGLAGEEGIWIDRNFPVRWDPLRVERCGPYPLARPEARALAEFVLGRPSIAIVQRFSGLGARTPTELDWPSADLRAHRRVAAEGLLESVETVAWREGALLTFAYEQSGAFGFALPALARTSGDGPLPPVGEILPLARNAAGASLRLISSLPRLELTAGEPLALGAATWQLDLELRNLGRLPTASELGAARHACPPPQLEVTGGELIGAALLRATDSVAAPLSPKAGVVALREIDGGGVLRVRLFVAANSGAKLSLKTRATRAGLAQLDVTLP